MAEKTNLSSPTEKSATQSTKPATSCKLEQGIKRCQDSGGDLHKLTKKIERTTLLTLQNHASDTALTLNKSPHASPKSNVITLEEREEVLRSHFQNKISQEKTILQVWGITKGTSVKYKAAREKYQQILKEAGE